jgi:hypothetical protein
MKTIPFLVLPLTAAAAALPAYGAAPAPTPPGGFAFGKVTEANGSRFVVQGQSSVVGVILTKMTSISETKAVDTKALVTGACVTAVGTKDKHGRIAAQSVSLISSKGCPVGGGPGAFRERRAGGANAPRPPQNGNGNRRFQRPANFAAAFGTVASVKGTLLTVKGRGGSTKVVLSDSTRIEKRRSASPSAIGVGKCASVRGTASANGSIVTARNVDLSPAGKNGCTLGGGFGGFGFGGGPRA